MKYRQAEIKDIPEIQIVRNAVQENRLSDPALVPDKDVQDYITKRGRGWVCEIDNHIVGFSIVSLIDNNVWALFIHPQHDKKGIGKTLHEIMLDWYFNNTQQTLWLSTAPGTRAEQFYKKAGWKEAGMHGKNEIRFEMDINAYQQLYRKIS